MFNKLKQFKDLRDRAKELQAALGQESAEGTAAWGKIKVKINGIQQIENVSIDPSLLSDHAALETGLKEAFNDAIGKIQRVVATKMRDIGGPDLAKDMQDLLKKE